MAAVCTVQFWCFELASGRRGIEALGRDRRGGAEKAGKEGSTAASQKTIYVRTWVAANGWTSRSRIKRAWFKTATITDRPRNALIYDQTQASSAGRAGWHCTKSRK